jgi:hypothetical protein
MNTQPLATRGVGITMKPEHKSFWAKAPLWLIAISLFTIACCLVLLVIRAGAPDEKTVQAAAGTNETETADGKIATRRPSGRFDAGRRGDEVLVLNRGSSTRVKTTEANETIVSDAPAARPVQAVLITDPRPPAQAAVTVSTGPYESGIRGTVYLKGVAPAETTIDVADTPCAESGQAPRMTRFFVTGTNGGLANTFVFITQGLSGPAFPPSQDTLELTFTNCLVEPFISTATSGARMVVRDAEGLNHQLRFEGASGPNPQPLFGRGMVEFENLQSTYLARVSCDTHRWESAYVGVYRNPYFALTDEQGGFSITNLPPGKYTLEARHPSKQGFERATKSVQVKPKETATMDIELSPRPY